VWFRVQQLSVVHKLWVWGFGFGTSSKVVEVAGCSSDEVSGANAEMAGCSASEVVCGGAVGGSAVAEKVVPSACFGVDDDAPACSVEEAARVVCGNSVEVGDGVCDTSPEDMSTETVVPAGCSATEVVCGCSVDVGDVVCALGMKDEGFGLRALGSGFQAWALRLRVSSFGSRVLGFGFQVTGLGFGGQNLESRVYLERSRRRRVLS